MELQRGVVGDLATMVELREAVAESGLLETVRSMLEAARAAEIPVVHATVSWRADRRGTPLNTPLARHLANNPHQVLEELPPSSWIQGSVRCPAVTWYRTATMG